MDIPNNPAGKPSDLFCPNAKYPEEYWIANAAQITIHLSKPIDGLKYPLTAAL